MEGLLVGANLHLRIYIISLTAIHGACKRDANIPGSARALACYDWRPRQSAGRIATSSQAAGMRLEVCRVGAANSTRGACAPQKLLQPHLLGVFRLNPTA